MGLTKKERIEFLERKATKELEKIRSERRKSPPVMWETLLDGQEYTDVKFKKPMEYNFNVVEEQNKKDT
jgi:hypothetical protein|tara:strand:+ start:281 stop:487 length:207 start_codon:yes stop_codon:yes gene_type:complete